VAEKNNKTQKRRRKKIKSRKILWGGETGHGAWGPKKKNWAGPNVNTNGKKGIKKKIGIGTTKDLQGAKPKN